MANCVSLIWRILDFAGCQQPNAPMGQSLFHASLQDDVKMHTSTPHPVDLQDPQVESPPEDFQRLDGGYSGPPDWFTPPDLPAGTAADMVSVAPPVATSGGVDVETGQPAFIDQNGHTANDLSFWIPWEMTQTTDAPQMTLYPFTQLSLSRNAPDYSRWWDTGNL
ncbi:hypothetical protein SEPCBS119000_001078 [Sporothrix epigloea]|uniref:Uncharacterized protein n=1 Tax=Sporothrix epigloea TaxID=1892477 RepID=A0ABP0DBM2_9PEZI